MSIPKTAILVGCVVAALLAMTAGIESGRAGDAPSSPAVDGATPPANNPDDQPTAGQVDARIAALIEQLGDAEYRVRQKAQDELSKYSFEAFDALNAATTHDDLEIATRARYLLGLMRVDWDSKDDPPEVQEVLKDYQRQPIREKVSRMRQLANLSDRKGIAALCRLIRYERSTVLSKRAALAVLNLQDHDEPPTAELAAALHKHLGEKTRRGKPRTAAAWLLAWTAFRDDPQSAIRAWSQHVAEEHLTARSAPSQSSPEIAGGLCRREIAWLKKLDRDDEVTAAIHRLVEAESANSNTLAEALDLLLKQQSWGEVGKLSERYKTQFAANALLLYCLAQAQSRQGATEDAEKTAARAIALNPQKTSSQLAEHYTVARTLRTRGLIDWAQREFRYVATNGPADSPLAQVALSELLDCLIEREAWEDLDKEAAALSPRFGNHAILLYTQAQARAAQGDQPKADEIAQRALKLNPGKDSVQLDQHRIAAQILQIRGLADWAEREYRHVVETGDADNPVVIASQPRYAELLHDREEDLAAAETLQALLAALKTEPDIAAVAGVDPAAARARMHYFLATDFLAKGNTAKHHEQLAKALKAYPGEVDVLIACHRLADPPAALRTEFQRQIEATTATMRKMIALAPNEPTALNQYAWLAGNTGGNLDEALKYSKRSIELSPDSGAYHDTLAHVYFARGEYEEAVKAQIRAAELEPQSRLIARQLEVFRKKLQEQRKATAPKE